jgi:hypothetical protein
MARTITIWIGEMSNIVAPYGVGSLE